MLISLLLQMCHIAYLGVELITSMNIHHKLSFDILHIGFYQMIFYLKLNKEEYLLFTTIGNVTFTLLNPYSAGIDFSRQNLTSVDVRF